MQQKRDNLFIIIIFISLIFHIGIILILNQFIKIKNTTESRSIAKGEIVIDLSNYNVINSQNSFSSNLHIPVPKINKFTIKEKKLNIHTNIKIQREKIENYNLSDLANIPAQIPLTYPETSKNNSNVIIEKNSTSKELKGIGAKGRGATNHRGKTSTGKEDTRKILSSYLLLIKEKIKRNTHYPLIARKRELEGVVQVEFVIDKNGMVKKIKIIKSSGYRILDKAAKVAVLRSNPFPEIPEKVKKRYITIQLPIEFKLEE